MQEAHCSWIAKMAACVSTEQPWQQYDDWPGHEGQIVFAHKTTMEVPWLALFLFDVTP